MTIANFCIMAADTPKFLSTLISKYFGLFRNLDSFTLNHFKLKIFFNYRLPKQNISVFDSPFLKLSNLPLASQSMEKVVLRNYYY